MLVEQPCVRRLARSIRRGWISAVHLGILDAMRSVLYGIAITFVAWGALHPTASADEPAGGEIAEGRAAFLAATQAASEQRWADALVGFERAYVLTSAPPALLNVGIVLRALGRFRDARDAFDRLVVEHAEFAAQVEVHRLRLEVAARVAALVLTELEPDAPHVVRLDGRSLGVRAGPRLELELDPGDHAVLIERDGFRAWQWEGTLGSGERRELRVELVALPVTPAVTTSRSKFARRLALSLGALTAVVGVALAVVLQRRAQLRPTHANALEL